jgi:hypothetical protein
MLDQWRELRRIRNAERDLARRERQVRGKLLARNGSRDAIREATEPIVLDQLALQEDRAYLYHRQLTRRAAKLFIPLPPRNVDDMFGDEIDEFWEPLQLSERWVLNMKGIRQVRSEIREERKARRDYLLSWIIPFIGILGVIIGAVAGYLFGVSR